jgi:hypothetical protein
VPETNPAAFISYSREDSEFALRLAQDLKAAGAAVWIDQLDIAAGELWDNAIEQALIASPRMLLILSPGSARSNNVRNEISFALEQGKTVIPVLYQDCTVPLQLQRANRVDFRADYTHGLNYLLASLQVEHPNPEVLHDAAEAEAKRKAAWEAREAEARRLQELADRKPGAGDAAGYSACVFAPVSHIRVEPAAKSDIACSIDTIQTIRVGETPIHRGVATWWPTDYCGTPGYIADNQIHVQTECPTAGN